MFRFEKKLLLAKARTVALQISSRPIAHVRSLFETSYLARPTRPTRHGVMCSGSLNFYRGSADVEAPCVVEPGKDPKTEKLGSRQLAEMIPINGFMASNILHHLHP